MPDDDNTPENRENGGEPADTDEAPAGDTGETGGDEVAKLRREAANYRTKLREAESRIEELDGQVYANRRLEAERLAGEELASGSDLFRDGATIEDLLGDDGLVDPDKVREATASVLEAHPHYAKPKGPAGSADGGLGEAPPARVIRSRRRSRATAVDGDEAVIKGPHTPAPTPPTSGTTSEPRFSYAVSPE